MSKPYLRLLFSNILFLIIFSSSSVPALPKLVIYTYDSFLSEWGPGPLLTKPLEEACLCKIEWVAAADGAALLARLRIEGAKTKADLVIGIDDTLWSSAEESEFFIDHGIPLNSSNLPSEVILSAKFLPYDFGYYAFMFDTQAKGKNGKPVLPPTSLDQLLSSSLYRKSIIIEDPRTSAPGMGLLLWLKAQYGDQYEVKLQQLRNQILTVGKGWSQAYGLFTKGEAPFVFSYITSEAYHKAVEKSDRYQALHFKEGHYVTVEAAGILKSSTQKDLAKKLLAVLLTNDAQATIASKNWMLPISKIKTGLPTALIQIKIPPKTLHIASSEVHKNRTKWTSEWLKTYKN